MRTFYLLPVLAALLFYKPAAASDPCSSNSAVSNPGRSVAADGAAGRVYPNPWRSDRHGGQQVRFESAEGMQSVMVFTASGRWVRTIHCACAQRQTDWDLLNAAGQPVKSGIYVYLIRDVYGRQTRGTVAVMR